MIFKALFDNYRSNIQFYSTDTFMKFTEKWYLSYITWEAQTLAFGNNCWYFNLHTSHLPMLVLWKYKNTLEINIVLAQSPPLQLSSVLHVYFTLWQRGDGVYGAGEFSKPVGFRRPPKCLQARFLIYSHDLLFSKSTIFFQKEDTVSRVKK